MIFLIEFFNFKIVLYDFVCLHYLLDYLKIKKLYFINTDFYSSNNTIDRYLNYFRMDS